MHKLGGRIDRIDDAVKAEIKDFAEHIAANGAGLTAGPEHGDGGRVKDALDVGEIERAVGVHK